MSAAKDLALYSDLDAWAAKAQDPVAFRKHVLATTSDEELFMYARTRKYLLEHATAAVRSYAASPIGTYVKLPDGFRHWMRITDSRVAAIVGIEGVTMCFHCGTEKTRF